MVPNMKIKPYLLTLCLILLAACSPKPNYTRQIPTNRYAKGFDIRPQDRYTCVTVFSPWHQGQTLATYYLIDNDTVTTPSDGQRVRVPIARLSATSCTHVGFLAALNRQSALVGICNPPIVYDSITQQYVKEGRIADVGDAMTPDVERILRTAPEAVMVSTFAQGDAATEKLLSLGMTVIYNNEWTENDPLARAEWIRFVGAFFNAIPQADSVFEQVEKDYRQLKQTVANIEQKRSIMSGNNFRGTWYMPSGNTYMGKLFRDAGADYRFQNDTANFSIPMTVENVVMNFEDADVWVGAAAQSLQELQDIDKKHTWFQSFRQGEVYNFYRRTTAGGANDFWESGVVHPERILHDLILVLYPDSLPDSHTFYYTRHLL